MNSMAAGLLAVGFSLAFGASAWALEPSKYDFGSPWSGSFNENGRGYFSDGNNSVTIYRRGGNAYTYDSMSSDGRQRFGDIFMRPGSVPPVEDLVAPPTRYTEDPYVCGRYCGSPEHQDFINGRPRQAPW